MVKVRKMVTCSNCGENTNLLWDMGFFCEHCDYSIDANELMVYLLERINELEEKIDKIKLNFP